MLRLIRLIRLLFLAVLAICLVVLALANRRVVTLELLPDEMAAFFGIDLAIRVPLYFVVFGGIVAGLLIGFVWEWLREHRHRAQAARASREAQKLEREVGKLRKKQPGGGDDVLALLEDERRAG